MQVVLSDKYILPLDVALESILPGVHRHFVAMEGHLKQDPGPWNLLSPWQQAWDHGPGWLSSRLCGPPRVQPRVWCPACWDHLLQVAARLVLPASTFQAPALTTNLWSPTTRQQQAQQLPSLAGDSLRHHQMVLKHNSIKLLWNKWYGLGDCEDKPVVGGIAAIERHHKSKWWNHFSASEKKHFSRSQIIIWASNTTYEDTK